jgi:hypothetical protein
MTHQDQIIIFCILALFAVPVGTFTAIKTVKKLTRPVSNTLVRHGDIELGDYIQPIQDYPDLLDSPTPIFDRVAIYDRVPSYWSGVPPYQSGTLPYYQSYDRLQLNSCLENENFINLYFIWIIFIFILIIIFKMKSLYAMSILIPFSVFEINFRDSFEWKFYSYRAKPKISYMKLQTLTEDIIKLLDSLNDDKNYSMSLSFISSYNNWKDNKEKVYPLFINDAIIVNKESDPVLITEFIIRSLNEKGLLKTNWLFKDHLINSMDPQILTVTVAIKIEI